MKKAKKISVSQFLRYYHMVKGSMPYHALAALRLREKIDVSKINDPKIDYQIDNALFIARVELVLEMCLTEVEMKILFAKKHTEAGLESQKKLYRRKYKIGKKLEQHFIDAGLMPVGNCMKTEIKQFDNAID